MSVNTRQETADLAKGMAVLFMIQVHLTELFATPELFASDFGRISLFLGGPPVAPLFMAVLGYFLAASRRSVPQLLWRGMIVLGVAFALNLGLNFHLLIRIATGRFALNPLEYVLGVDILFLAALAILILAVLRPIFRASALWPLIMAIVIAGVTPLVNEGAAASTWSPYLLAFAGGDARWSYFPLFPWLAYPLLGWAFFHWRQSRTSPDRWPRGVRQGVFALSGIVVATFIGYGVEIAAELPAYYHHGLLYFCWVTVFLVFWIMVLGAVNRLAGQSLPVRYVKWLGEHVTVVYVLQWLAIGNLATWLYRTQSLAEVGGWLAAILTFVSLATLAVERTKSARRTQAKS